MAGEGKSEAIFGPSGRSFVIIPRIVVRYIGRLDPKVTPSEWLILSHLFNEVRQTAGIDQIRVRQASLAEWTGMSGRRVKQILQALKAWKRPPKPSGMGRFYAFSKGNMISPNGEHIFPLKGNILSPSSL